MISQKDQPQEQEEYLFKLLILGDVGTGKTAIIKRYVHGTFNANYKSTIGVDFALKVIQRDEHTSIRIQLWDIAGQERFGNMTRVYYREAKAAVVVFDQTRDATLEGAVKWRQDIESKLGDEIPVILFANKADMVTTPMPPEELEAFCAKHKFNAGWIATSARANTGIVEGMNVLVERLLPKGPVVSVPTRTETIKLGEPSAAEQTTSSGGGCCK